MKVSFVRSEKTAKDIRTFWFRPEKPFRYIAGQYIELYLPHNNSDTRAQKRWFTLSSPPNLDMVSITTKIILEASSFKKTLGKLKPGDIVDMSLPMGDFVLPKTKFIPLVFIAGGIGCTPYHSIIASLQNTGETRDITLLYAAKADEEIAFKDVFSKLGKNFHKYTDGTLTAKKVLDIIGDTGKKYFYLSGPEPLVEQLQKEFWEQNIPKNHIYTDFFPGYTAI